MYRQVTIFVILTFSVIFCRNLGQICQGCICIMCFLLVWVFSHIMGLKTTEFIVSEKCFRMFLLLVVFLRDSPLCLTHSFQRHQNYFNSIYISLQTCTPPADLHYGATAVNCYMTETHMIPGTFLML